MSKSILTSLVALASLFAVQADVGPIGEPADDYIIHNNIPFNSNGGTVGIYDLTPGDGATNQNLFAGDLTVEFDISTAQGTSSVGIHFLDPANQNNNLLALVNLDNNLVTNETIRFFRDGNLPSAGTLVGAAVNGDGGLNISPDSAPVWGHVVVDYIADNGSGAPQLTLTIGSFSVTSAYLASDTLPSNVEVGFRMYDVNGTGTLKLDNLQIIVVPEPGSAALLGLGLGGWLLLRRQRRTA